MNISKQIFWSGIVVLGAVASNRANDVALTLLILVLIALLVLRCVLYLLRHMPPSLLEGERTKRQAAPAPLARPAPIPRPAYVARAWADTDNPEGTRK